MERIGRPTAHTRLDGTPRLARLALRRRSGVEQRVIRMIRGDDRDAGDGPHFHAAQFGRLRTLAVKNGLAVQPADAPFVSIDELRLLAWLAQSQRVLGYRRTFHSDAILTLTIVHCAGSLDAMDVHLPPIILHGVGTQEAAASERGAGFGV